MFPRDVVPGADNRKYDQGRKATDMVCSTYCSTDACGIGQEGQMRSTRRGGVVGHFEFRAVY